MQVRPAELEGVLVIDPVVHGDERGFFVETYAKERYVEAGLTEEFVQDNLSLSSRGTLRGLHLQHPHGQGKLCYVLEGEVFDVAVDVRAGSPSFGKWTGVRLSSETKRQLYVPPGFAHGFCVLSERALFSYKCTDLYHRECELGIAWDDPDIGIDWPVAQPRLSDKDAHNLRLKDISVERLPRYE